MGRSVVRRVLVVDDQRHGRDAYASLILNGSAPGRDDAVQNVFRTEVCVSSDAIGALTTLDDARAAGRPFHVLVTDLYMQPVDGLELIQRVSERGVSDSIDVILLSSDIGASDRRSEIERVRSAWLQAGGTDIEVVLRPEVVTTTGGDLHPDEFLHALWQGVFKKLAASGHRQPEARAALSPKEAWRSVYLTTNPSLSALIEQCLLQWAPTSAPILVSGPTGTGKGVLARLIHDYSRPRKPYVKSIPADIPESLLESQLFGFEKGAFTGALTAFEGHFRAANGGTLFLDEVGELPLAQQTKLLRAIEDREIVPLGRSTPLSVDCRLVAATNVEIPEAVAEGRFRKDLYYRLQAFEIHLPSLNDRREDVPLLVNHFWTSTQGDGFPARTEPLSDAVIQRLVARDWPGNAREVLNAMKRLKAVTAGRCPTVDDLASDAAIEMYGLSLLSSQRERTLHIMFYPVLRELLRAPRSSKIKDLDYLSGTVARAYGLHFADDLDGATQSVRSEWHEHTREERCSVCRTLWRQRWP